MNALRRHVGGFVALGAAVMWLVLALDRPASTFHFAPIIVAGAWPVLARTGAEHSLETRAAALRAGAGLALAVMVTSVLAVTDSLQGPSLWNEDSAGLEAVLFAVGGAVAGMGFAVVRS